MKKDPRLAKAGGRAHKEPGMHAAKPGEVPPYEEGDEIPF
jgi:hypothetical protein